MSPIPSPTPLRCTIVRFLFSPAALLMGFVVLLISTCPGARGEGSIGLLAANDVGLISSASTDLAKYDIRVAPARQPSAVIGRSTRFDRVPTSSARSATPMERSAAAPAAADGGAFRHSRSALPLLVDPLLNETAGATPSARLSPMTGPAVGIRPKLPASIR